MLNPRIIPCLLLKGGGLVKTVKFSNEKYVGDPINAVKIFNEKGADELIFLDISATADKRKPCFDIIEMIASECFMPVCYGGGIRQIDDVKRIFALGVEKVSISSYAVEKPEFIKELSKAFGSQSIIVCLDVAKNLSGDYEIVTNNARKWAGLNPFDFAVEMERLGAGELLINSVDKDGAMTGYDLDLIKQVTGKVNIPVIACGGAGSLNHICEVITSGGASSAAAGSLLVYCGSRKGVLISYPKREDVDIMFEKALNGTG
jgi:cyclase